MTHAGVPDDLLPYVDDALFVTLHEESPMTSEPVLTVASITALATAVLGALVAFGVNLTEAQTTAVLGVVAVAAPLVVGLVARRKVTPYQGEHEA